MSRVCGFGADRGCGGDLKAICMLSRGSRLCPLVLDCRLVLWALSSLPRLSAVDCRRLALSLDPQASDSRLSRLPCIAAMNAATLFCG